MRMTETVISGVLTAGLLWGTPSTYSENLRPVRELSREIREGQSELGISKRQKADLSKVPIQAISTGSTDDGGTKLADRGGYQSGGTGDWLFDYPTLSNAKLSTVKVDVYEKSSVPLPLHTEAVAWIQQLVNLSEERIGAMLGVNRITIRNWKEGLPIKGTNLRRLLETKDVLERATRNKQGNGQLVAWLEEPDSETGVSPRTLLEQGDISRARLLAVMDPSSVAPIPAWATLEVPTIWRDSLEQPENSGELADGTLS